MRGDIERIQPERVRGAHERQRPEQRRMNAPKRLRQSQALILARRRRQCRDIAAGCAPLPKTPARLLEPTSQLWMGDVRLRLGRQSARDLIHVAARLGDHAVKIGGKLPGMYRQQLPSTAALLVGGPVG